jgi:hypothetical protein
MTEDSPCSVPDWLRREFPLETPEQQAVCRWHDAEYADGGDRLDRLVVDLEFAMKLLDAEMEPDTAELYFWGVRQYGGRHWAGGDLPGAEPPLPPPPDDVNAP